MLGHALILGALSWTGCSSRGAPGPGPRPIRRFRASTGRSALDAYYGRRRLAGAGNERVPCSWRLAGGPPPDGRAGGGAWPAPPLDRRPLRLGIRRARGTRGAERGGRAARGRRPVRALGNAPIHFFHARDTDAGPLGALLSVPLAGAARERLGHGRKFSGASTTTESRGLLSEEERMIRDAVPRLGRGRVSCPSWPSITAPGTFPVALIPRGSAELGVFRRDAQGLRLPPGSTNVAYGAHHGGARAGRFPGCARRPRCRVGS